MASDPSATRRSIANELQLLNETLSFAAPTSALQHQSDVYQKDRLPLSQKLPQHSQLRTMGTAGFSGLRATQAELLNQMGNTLSRTGSQLPGDKTGRILPDAEVRSLEATGSLDSAATQRAATKAMTTRDTVNVHLHMKDKPMFETDYRGNFQFGTEAQESIATQDKSNVGIFKLDEYRTYVEAANKYRAWPPQTGVPPWPPRKV